MNNRFLTSMKTALKSLADVNNERMTTFPVDPSNPSVSVSRIAVYLHLFHHQVCNQSGFLEVVEIDPLSCNSA